MEEGVAPAEEAELLEEEVAPGGGSRTLGGGSCVREEEANPLEEAATLAKDEQVEHGRRKNRRTVKPGTSACARASCFLAPLDFRS